MEAGIIPLLSSVVMSEDITIASLASQALLDIMSDRHAQPRAKQEIEEGVGDEFYGHLRLASLRQRPHSPAELDMLLVL